MHFTGKLIISWDQEDTGIWENVRFLNFAQNVGFHDDHVKWQDCYMLNVALISLRQLTENKEKINLSVKC